MRRFLQFIFFISVALGCTEDEKPTPAPTNIAPAITSVGSPIGSPVSKKIGTAGGTIASGDGIVELSIPAGALSSEVEITIQPVTNTAPSGIGLAYDLLPNGTAFAKPAKLTFNYLDEDINGSSPLSLYVAYQDQDRSWVVERGNQHLDSISKTVSLDINHFTIFSEGLEYPRVVGNRLTLKAGETCELQLVETVVIGDDTNSGRLTSTSLIPDQVVRGWKVNSHFNGSSVDGTIEGSGSKVTYRAPAQIRHRKRITIAAATRIKITAVQGNTKIVINEFEPLLEVTLLPSVLDFKYHIEVAQVDSSLSPFYGRLLDGLPVYTDKATFDLEIGVENGTVDATASNIHNVAPSVAPATKEFHGTEFVWIPDSTGVINIKSVTLSFNSIIVTEDSLLQFSIAHNSASFPGMLTQSAEDGSLYSKSSPVPYPDGVGIPQIIDVDLKKKEAHYYFSNPLGLSGAHTSVYIVPMN